MIELLDDIDYLIKTNDIKGLKSLIDSQQIEYTSKTSILYGSEILKKSHIFELFLQDPRLIDVIDANFLLLTISRTNNIELFKLILKYTNADINYLDYEIIRNVFEDNNSAMVDFLVEHPKFVANFDDDFPIGAAAKYGNINVVKKLLKNPLVNPAIYSNYAFRNAVKGGFLNIVKLLIDIPSVNPADFGSEALCYAANNSHIEILKLLLKEENIDPARSFNEAIWKADLEERIEVVELLWEQPKVKNTLKIDIPELYQKLSKKDIHNNVLNF